MHFSCCTCVARGLACHACMRAACYPQMRPASMNATGDGLGKRFSPRNSAEEAMKTTHRFWRYLVMPISFAGMLSISSAAELNPAAVIYKLPDQIPWRAADGREIGR